MSHPSPSLLYTMMHPSKNHLHPTDETHLLPELQVLLHSVAPNLLRLHPHLRHPMDLPSLEASPPSQTNDIHSGFAPGRPSPGSARRPGSRRGRAVGRGSGRRSRPVRGGSETSIPGPTRGVSGATAGGVEGPRSGRRERRVAGPGSARPTPASGLRAGPRIAVLRRIPAGPWGAPERRRLKSPGFDF